MFTGIIEETGAVASVAKGAKSARLTVEASKIFEDLKLGDSVAVNGICLTVAELGGRKFSADVMNETLSRSDLGDLQVGNKVNLERAMPSDGRFGGHIVSGHIDGTGRITKTERDDNAIWITVSAPSGIMRYIVEKGSIAIDGISLTVARTEKSVFSVSVIPHTGKETSLLGKKIGDTVNLENDIVGKYIDRFLSINKLNSKPESSITLEFLERAGF